jgi:hypothetical protein
MRSSTDATIACARTRSDRTDMRAGIGAVLVNARATAGNGTDMGACANAMAARARLRSDRTDMRSGTDAMIANSRATAGD